MAGNPNPNDVDVFDMWMVVIGADRAALARHGTGQSKAAGPAQSSAMQRADAEWQRRASMPPDAAKKRELENYLVATKGDELGFSPLYSDKMQHAGQQVTQELADAHKVYAKTGKIPQTRYPWSWIEIKERRSMSRAERDDAMVKKMPKASGDIATVEDVNFDNRDPEYLTKAEFKAEFDARLKKEYDACEDKHTFKGPTYDCEDGVDEKYGGENFVAYRDSQLQREYVALTRFNQKAESVENSGPGALTGRVVGRIIDGEKGEDIGAIVGGGLDNAGAIVAMSEAPSANDYEGGAGLEVGPGTQAEVSEWTGDRGESSPALTAPPVVPGLVPPKADMAPANPPAVKPPIEMPPAQVVEPSAPQPVPHEPVTAGKTEGPPIRGVNQGGGQRTPQRQDHLASLDLQGNPNTRPVKQPPNKTPPSGGAVDGHTAAANDNATPQQRRAVAGDRVHPADPHPVEMVRKLVPSPAPQTKTPTVPTPPVTPTPAAAKPPKGQPGGRQFGPDPTSARPKGTESIEDADILSQHGVQKRTAYPSEHQHHLFPQELRTWFEKAGIKIDEHTVFLSEGIHQALHLKGVNLKGWNQEWKDFKANFEANLQDATEQQIFEKAGKLMEKYRISDADIATYGQKK